MQRHQIPQPPMPSPLEREGRGDSQAKKKRKETQIFCFPFFFFSLSSTRSLPIYNYFFSLFFYWRFSGKVSKAASDAPSPASDKLRKRLLFFLAFVPRHLRLSKRIFSLFFFFFVFY